MNLRNWLIVALLLTGCAGAPTAAPTPSSQPAVTAADSTLDCEGDELVVTTETQITWSGRLHTVATIGCQTPAGLSGERVEVFAWQNGWRSAGYLPAGDELWNTDSGCFIEDERVGCSVYVWLSDTDTAPGTLWVGYNDGDFAAELRY